MSWEPVIPFEIVASKGGPHEDLAFVAGFRLGSLNAAFSIGHRCGEPSVMSVMLRCEELHQADLLAMSHGFVATANIAALTPDNEGSDGHEWHAVTFQKVDEDRDHVPAFG
jgi:hypothetical protein